MDFDSIKLWLGTQSKKQSRSYAVQGWIGVLLCPVALWVAMCILWGFVTMINRRWGNPPIGSGLRWSINLLGVGLMFLGNRLVSTKDLVQEYYSGDPVDRALARYSARGNMVWFIILLWILFAGPRLLDWGRNSLRRSSGWRNLDKNSCAAVLVVLFTHPRRVDFEEIKREIPWLNLEETLPDLIKIPGLLHLTGAPAGLAISDELRKSIRTGDQLEPAIEPVAFGVITMEASQGIRALVIGCSDGIGLALVRKLVAQGWQVTGVSRSESPVTHENYLHHVRDVAADGYRNFLGELLAKSAPFSACVYCVGIGEGFNPTNLDPDALVMRVNLLAAVETAAALIPDMVRRRQGKFIVLSSLADLLRLANSPAYAGSKAGVSAYFESLALAMQGTGVSVTNIRFGFIDTKMAIGPTKPFLRSPQWAADVIVRALHRNDIRISRPRRMALLVGLLAFLTNWRIRLAFRHAEIKTLGNQT